MSRSILSAAVLAALAAATPAVAEEAPAPASARAPAVRLHVRLSYDFGTARLVSVPFQDGSSEIVHGGDGYALAVGAVFLPLLDGRLETQATLGVKYKLVAASNGNLWYYGFPLELLEYLNVAPFRLGAGLQLLLGPRLRGTGDASATSVSFDPALGVVLSADYVWRFRGASRGALAIGPRVVLQDQTSDATGTKSANAIGVNLGFTF